MNNYSAKEQALYKNWCLVDEQIDMRESFCGVGTRKIKVFLNQKVKKGDKIVKFNTYPSKRMFDTMSVWGDITSGLLADMTMIQWIIIALIFDIVSFILFTIFRNQ